MTQKGKPVNTQRQVPAWQQAIIDKCHHPRGGWEAFPESSYGDSIPIRFEAVAARFAERDAVVDWERSFTYSELNRLANRTAHGLIHLLGSSAQPVIHFFEPSAYGVAAILGIAKSGKFYTALNTRSPLDYQRQTVMALRSKLILTDADNQRRAEEIAGNQARVLLLDAFAEEADSNPQTEITPESNLYVIFTSSSTGTPKGVIEKHRNAIRFAAEYINVYHVSPDDRNLMTQRLGFGSGQATLFASLLSGSTLLLYNVHHQGILGLPGWIEDRNPTIVDFPPVLFRTLAEVCNNPQSFKSIRLLRFVGDRTLPVNLDAFHRLLPDSSLLRTGMGSSEAMLCTDILYDKPTLEDMEEVCTGWPIREAAIYIVDESGNRLPPGSIGEIIVCSPYLSPGYWEQPELTRQKFRPDPSNPGYFLYSTGDLGCIGSDGGLYHKGRIDSRVKFQGNQIELHAIERALLRLEGVTAAIVDLWPVSPVSQQLCAWYTMHEGSPMQHGYQLRQALAERLPSYMIPERFIYLDGFPVNPNGKIDRRSLPAPDMARPPLAIPYTAAQTPVELIIVAIWRDILGLDEIGTHDPFLELGGNSLQAMRIAARVQEEFGVEIPLAELFAAATVAEMALAVVAELASEAQMSIPQEK